MLFFPIKNHHYKNQRLFVFTLKKLKGFQWASGRKSSPKDKEKSPSDKEKEKQEKLEREKAEKAAKAAEKAEKERAKKEKEKAAKDKKGIKVAAPVVPVSREEDGKKKEEEAKQQEKAAKPASPSHTKEYVYQESDPNTSPTSKDYSARGFRYDEDPSKRKTQDGSQLSPTSEGRKAIGVAFNYAPGEEDKLKEKAEQHRDSLSPRTREKLEKGQLSPKTREKLLKDGNLSPKTRAKLSAFHTEHPELKKDAKSYSPMKPGKNETPGTGTYKTIDPTSAFIEGERYDKDGKDDKESKPIAEALQAGAVAAGIIKPEATKKRVKIMVIISKIDPKTKIIDTVNGSIEHSIGVQDEDIVETKYGVIDVRQATIEVVDPQTGEKKKFKGVADPKTHQIIFNAGGVVNATANKLDDTLGQVVCIAPQEIQLVEVTSIHGTLDKEGKKLDTDQICDVETTNGYLNEKDQTVQTKYGVINLKTCEVKVPEKGNKHKIIENALDPLTGQALIKDADNKHGRLVSFGSPIDPIVEITTVSGKLDRKGGIDKKGATIECTSGQIDLERKKVNTKYGQFDLEKHTIAAQNPKNGKMEVKEATIDPTGQIVLKNQVNPKTNKPDKDYGRVLSLRIVQSKTDSSGKPILNEATDEIKVSPKTHQIWIPTGKNPNNNETIYVANQVDKFGNITVIYGYFNPKTNEVEKTTKLDENVKLDPVSGQVYTATGDKDEASGEPLYTASQVDPATGEVLTKIGKIDPKTGRLVIIRILIVTKRDDRGKPQELDPKTVEINPHSGVINKTVFVYKMVDPVTGQTIQVDPDDPRIAGARTTVTQTLTLSGEIDAVTGRIKTEWGHIDPNTGDIDPSTAVRDPVTGKLVLNYADIEPSHFGKDVQVTKETVPITRDQFYEGIKHLGADALRRDSDGSDEMNEYGSENTSKIVTSPTVVKTTTKQMMKKDDGGVTHNVEEQVQNLRTGETTISTQEHKVCVKKNF